MKKVSFSNIKGLLSKNEMKQVKGGLALAGTCGFRLATGEAWCGMSSGEAQTAQAANPGSYWCCDSCGGNGGSASYC